MNTIITKHNTVQSTTHLLVPNSGFELATCYCARRSIRAGYTWRDTSGSETALCVLGLSERLTEWGYMEIPSRIQARYSDGQ